MLLLFRIYAKAIYKVKSSYYSKVSGTFTWAYYQAAGNDPLQLQDQLS